MVTAGLEASIARRQAVIAMTEQEWRRALEPHSMLEFLQTNEPSQRKLRLFAVACSRRVWPLINDLGRAAIGVAENFADGVADEHQLRAIRLACKGAGDQAAWYAAASMPVVAARNAALSAQAGTRNSPALSETEELLAQASLVREIFGYPFRRCSVHAEWRTPNVIELAEAVYEERGFERLPSLADALVWRRIQVRDCTLDKLHERIQTAMGWTNSHLNHFKIGEQLYGDPLLMDENFEEFGYEDSATTRIGTILPKSGERFQFEYEYDFGENGTAACPH